jgi:hypothetical protein
MAVEIPNEKVSSPFNPASFDYSSLTMPVTADSLADFKRTAAGSTLAPRAARLIRRGLGRLVLTVIAWILLLFVPVLAITSGTIGLTAASLPSLKVLYGVLIAVGILLAGAGTAWIVRDATKNISLRVPWEAWLRLTRFADDNGFQYLAASGHPRLMGSIFDTQMLGRVTDRLIWPHEPFFESGNFHSDRNQNTRGPLDRGYLAVKLHRSLPHMVLRATSNGTSRGIPGTIDTTQVLSLQGDFNRHFSLYAPKSFESDALYVFTPDLMALLIDEASAFDAEIVDDWIIFVSPERLTFHSPSVVTRLMRIVEIVGAKTFGQADHYRDDRADGTSVGNIITPPRLGLRFRTVTWASLFAVFWVALKVANDVLQLLHLR